MEWNQSNAIAEIYDSTELNAILEQLGSEEIVSKGTYLFRIGQPKMPDIVLLRKGTVKASQITASGEEHIYNIFRSGSQLFLLAAITNEPPALNFIATSQFPVLR